MEQREYEKTLDEAMTEILTAQGITDAPTPEALDKLKEWLREAYLEALYNY